MQWRDERELVLVSLIASILFMTVLDFQLGVIYTGMLLTYYIFLAKPYSIQFSRDKKYLSPSLLLISIIGIISYYLIAQIFNIPIITIKSIMGFSIDMISIANPILKTLIWVFFIPLAETLFLFGVIFGYIKYKMKINELNITAIIMFIILGVLITAFHLKSQDINQNTLLIDIAFTTISGILVLKYKELKQAYWFHVLLNVIGLYLIGGLLWLLH